MRRPPIACQRAVQSLQSPAPQHIWVPDEVLSLAVHRFFHSTCPQQKRHGSNIPGPLEARRRAAKRRMTASAGFYPQESFPTSFSFGALFSYRSKPENSWRYEPPSPPKNVPSSGTRTLGGCCYGLAVCLLTLHSLIRVGQRSTSRLSTSAPSQRTASNRPR
jgi:hypothetical protein